MSFLLAIMTCSTVFAVISCTPNGPPSNACTTLTPNHPTSTGTGAAPYELTVNPPIYGPGDQVTVTISKTGADDFRGIIVQARQKTGGNTDPVGTFSTPSTGTKVLFCGATDNTWGHSDPSDKSTVTATWTAPASGGEDLVFHYSIVQTNDDTDGSVFYTGLMTDLTFMIGPESSSGATTATGNFTFESNTGTDSDTETATEPSTTESNAGYHRASAVTIAFVLFAVTILQRLL